jgi:hypothetical protein
VDGVAKSGFKHFLARQALAVSLDMLARYNRNRGGKRAFSPIMEDYENHGGGGIVLIGHSGGGVAAYGAGKMLHDRGFPVEKIILVGCPGLRIADDWQERVRSIRKAGRLGDPVTWLRIPFPGAPRNQAAVNIVGWHREYFRRDLADEGGVSNLAKTMNIIWEWIKP